MTKTYLVTGGAGFIGSHVCEELLRLNSPQNKIKIIIIDDFSTGKEENIFPGTEVIRGDISDYKTLENIFSKNNITGIYHLAAVASVQKSIEELTYTHRVNLSGTVNLFDLSQKYAQKNNNKAIPIVFASSAAIYGDNTNIPLLETEQAKPLSAYGADKYGCELHGFVAAHVHKIPNIGLRFFNVYGPRQDPSSPYSGVISIFSDRISSNKNITIFGDGKQTRDFIFVKDVCNALLTSMAYLENKNIFEIFNVCTGKSTYVKELADILIDLENKKNKIKINYEAAREGDIKESLGNPDKLKNILGISAKTELRNGLKILLDSI